MKIRFLILCLVSIHASSAFSAEDKKLTLGRARPRPVDTTLKSPSKLEKQGTRSYMITDRDKRRKSLSPSVLYARPLSRVGEKINESEKDEILKIDVPSFMRVPDPDRYDDARVFEVKRHIAYFSDPEARRNDRYNTTWTELCYQVWKCIQVANERKRPYETEQIHEASEYFKKRLSVDGKVLFSRRQHHVMENILGKEYMWDGEDWVYTYERTKKVNLLKESGLILRSATFD